ncbi:MAG TPA: phosphatidate cytidylyltransferase [Burkholderiales bacterium]|nr:phosphatidate cytidylyltransferase [Burkholderiales bacterium]
MFLTRALTVLIALPVFTAALFLLPPWTWALLLLAALFIACQEWGTLSQYGKQARLGYAAICAASALALFQSGAGSGAGAGSIEIALYALSCAFWVVIAPLWIRGHWKIRDPAALGVAGWIALVPMWLALVRLQIDPWVLLTVLGVVWIADTSAYIAGKQWGRHKLAPMVSPGKSWEGVVGAVVGVGIYYAALWFIVPPDRRLLDAAAGAGVFAALLALSIVGDLFESWLKRQAGVKDSGQLLPGHGGILDRIDGLTATLPTAALALHLL